MSFASSAREEIAQRSPTKECCVRAAAYGIACFAKYFDARGLVLQTEQPHTVQLAQQLFARCGIRGEILEKPRASGVLYEFNIRDAEQVTRLHELFGTTGRETSLQIDPGLIRCQTCVSAYIAMAFLCSGTVTDPQKEYNLEFLTSRTNLARDFEALLAEHEFAPPPQRREPDLRQDRCQCGAFAQLYGRCGCSNTDQRTQGVQAGAQPDQPADQLRYRKPWQNGAGKRSDPEGHPLFAGAARTGDFAGGIAAGSSQASAIPGSFAYRAVRLL